MSESRFRPKIKTAQIFINIPGKGSFSLESGVGQSEEQREKLKALLQTTWDRFWSDYGHAYPKKSTPAPQAERAK